MARQSLRAFGSDRSGAVAASYALALPMLVALAGVGFDYGRMVSLDTELQNGADQAALAAVTQLDGQTGACNRAIAALSTFVRNDSLLATTAGAITFASETGCDATGSIRFWKDKAKTIPALADADANFIEVGVQMRSVQYALTPIVGATNPQLNAWAMAGIGGAICGTSVLSYCNPSLPADFDADAYKGRGIVVGGKSGSGSWGYLQLPGATNSSKEDVEEALAQDQPAIECRSTSGNPEVVAGSPTGLVSAVNTRFDMFVKNITNPNSPCEVLSDCSPAVNVIKDVVERKNGQNAVWELPNKQFSPKAASGAYNPSTAYDADNNIDAMGLPRDLCHYGTYGQTCANGLTGNTQDIGTGNWARQDYFTKVHPGEILPSNVSSMTRYETYLWEIEKNSLLPAGGIKIGANTWYGRPVTVAASTSAFDRRVITVAFTRGTNGSCPGQSSPSVPVLDWVEVFFVEPGVSARGNYPTNLNANSSDPLYFEIIGKARSGGNAPQFTRRDVPYLVQ